MLLPLPLATQDYRKASNPQLKMVVSCSYGGQNEAPITKALVQEAAARGDVMFVAAAGNDNR